jgi:hypothetical protein
MAETRGKGWNSFQFRRAYFTLEHKISENFKVRFRTDADREVDDKARVYVKNLYLEWSRLIPQASLHIGMLSTPGKILSESVWGYRGIEKTLVHAFKEQTGENIDFFPADLGLGLKGNLGQFDFYHAVVVNGSGFSHPEGDKYKKFALQLGVTPLEGLFLAGYVDAEKQNVETVNYTYKGDLLYQGKRLPLGFEIFRYVDGMAGEERGGLSLFGNYAFAGRSRLFARMDRYNPVLGLNLDDKEIHLFLIGFDYSPHRILHLMPHVRIKDYEDGRRSDILAVMTLEIRH